MPRFVVDLGTVKLSDQEHAALAGAIHATVISYMSKLSDPSAHHGVKTLTRAGMGFAPPPDSPAPKTPKSTKAPAQPASSDTPKPAKAPRATKSKSA
jgi:hypothetical protein